MSFFTEFKNLTTDTYITNVSEFGSAAVGTKFQRKNGLIYIKTSAGYFDVDSSGLEDGSVDSTKFASVQSFQILDSAGTVIKTIYGAGV